MAEYVTSSAIMVKINNENNIMLALLIFLL